MLELSLSLGSLLELEHCRNMRMNAALIYQPADLDELGAIGMRDEIGRPRVMLPGFLFGRPRQR